VLRPVSAALENVEPLIEVPFAAETALDMLIGWGSCFVTLRI